MGTIQQSPIRQSNFELLRIVAMFLVLVVHADYVSLGSVTSEELSMDFLPSVTRIFVQALSIVCVNLFVLISGWFGIRATLKGFLNLIFQYLFAYCLVYAIIILTGEEGISLWNIGHFLVDLIACNWFILAYSALYFLSPLLNAGIKGLNKKRFQYLLVSFFLFQSIWGYAGAARWVGHGYSLFSFMGLYLLASYLRLYGIRFSMGLTLYIISTITNTLYCIVYLQPAAGAIGIIFPAFVYCNPLVIIGAAGLLLWFSQLRIGHSRLINWIARSSFMVFLIHTTPWFLEPYFCKWMEGIYNRYDSIECLAMMGIALIGIFVACVLVDQPRKWLWNWSLRAHRLIKNHIGRKGETNSGLPTPPHNKPL